MAAQGAPAEEPETELLSSTVISPTRNDRAPMASGGQSKGASALADATEATVATNGKSLQSGAANPKPTNDGRSTPAVARAGLAPAAAGRRRTWQLGAICRRAPAVGWRPNAQILPSRKRGSHPAREAHGNRSRSMASRNGQPVGGVGCPRRLAPSTSNDLGRSRDSTNERVNTLMLSRRVSIMSQEDERWLESMVGRNAHLSARNAAKRFKFEEDSFLTEMYTADQLKRVILPFSRFRRMWDVLTLVLVMYTAIALPLLIAFSESEQSPIGLRVVDVFTDLVFVTDVLINFNTAYVTKDAVLEINKPAIARHYAYTWAPVDILGSIPWEIITLIGESAGFKATEGQAIAIIKVLKAPKMLRIGRLFKFLARFEGAANIGRIFMLMFLFVLLLHWLGCGFYLLASFLSETRGKSWLNENDYDELPLSSRYLRAYYSVLLMIMGDQIIVNHDSETLYAIVVGLIGSCVNAVIFANVANLTAQLNSNSAMHQRRMDGVAQAMRRLNVERSTATRIRDYYEYVWVRHRNHQGDHFIRQLPAQLRNRTACMIHEAKLRSCPLFTRCDRKFIAGLATTLLPEVYLPSEFIVVAGYVSRAMYFVARGRVQLIRRTVQSTMQVEEAKEYFDEAGLFSETHHATSARSITHTDLYKLERHDFDRVVMDFPTAGHFIISAARQYMSQENATAVTRVVSDLVGSANQDTNERRSQIERRSSTRDSSEQSPIIAAAFEGAGATEQEQIVALSDPFPEAANRRSQPAERSGSIGLPHASASVGNCNGCTSTADE